MSSFSFDALGFKIGIPLLAAFIVGVTAFVAEDLVMGAFDEIINIMKKSKWYLVGIASLATLVWVGWFMILGKDVTTGGFSGLINALNFE